MGDSNMKTNDKPKSKRGRKPKPKPVSEFTSTPNPSATNAAPIQLNNSSNIWPPTSKRPSQKVADWDEFLTSDPDNLHFIPPVHWFKHAPLSSIWKDISKSGLVVEAPNPFVRCSKEVNWFATIVHYAGYKALIKFESLGVPPKYAAWMSFCSKVPKPLGYSDKNMILLHPPYVVREKFPDFLARARALLTEKNAATVREDHGEFIRAELLKCMKYPLNTLLEVMDYGTVDRMRVGNVTSTIGDRIHVTYIHKLKEDDNGFWFNCNSDLVHPLGWSQTVGHEICDVPMSAQFTPLSPDSFPKYPPELKLEIGQMFETRHPLIPQAIVAASVSRVLKYGYFMAEIRTVDEELPVRFAYHVSSPYIFPCGFCETMKIDLIPPFEVGGRPGFSWNKYFLKYKQTAAPLNLLPKRPHHNFKPGMKLEAVRVTEPAYLGPATVRRVCGHLLYLSFDGLPSVLEAWMDADSHDIYPIGYSELVGHGFWGVVEETGHQEACS